MALEYDTDHNKFEQLAPVLEEYADWFGLVALAVAYPEDKTPLDQIASPASFEAWVKDAEEAGDLGSQILEDIVKVHDDMRRIGGMLVEELKSAKKPVRESFVEFKNIYTAFLMRLRRLEKDTARDGSGMDEETGLRSAKMVEMDLKKEIERLARQGNPFSLALARIDKFAGQPNQLHAVTIATENVKRCMRSFDDAYYLGNGHFLLSLKHADIIGAQAAANRLQQYLNKDEGNQHKMTMSYCVAEPASGDEIKTLLRNMQEDLTAHLNDTNAVLKFLELSPLERFVNKMDT